MHNQECWDENTNKCHTKHNQECSEEFDIQCHTTYNQECWDEYSDQCHTEHSQLILFLQKCWEVCTVVTCQECKNVPKCVTISEETCQEASCMSCPSPDPSPASPPAPP